MYLYLSQDIQYITAILINTQHTHTPCKWPNGQVGDIGGWVKTELQNVKSLSAWPLTSSGGKPRCWTDPLLLVGLSFEVMSLSRITWQHKSDNTAGSVKYMHFIFIVRLYTDLGLGLCYSWRSIRPSEVSRSNSFWKILLQQPWALTFPQRGQRQNENFDSNNVKQHFWYCLLSAFFRKSQSMHL